MRVDPPYVLCSSIINFQYETKSTPEVWRCNGEMMCAVPAVCGGSMDRGLNPNLVLRSTTRSTHSGRHVVGAHVGGPQDNFIPTIFSFRLLFSSFLSLPSPFSFFLRADLQWWMEHVTDVVELMGGRVGGGYDLRASLPMGTDSKVSAAHGPWQALSD